MTTIELDPIAEELASLREQVRELRASVGKQSSPSTRSRRTVIVAGAAIAIATLMGSLVRRRPAIRLTSASSH